VNQIAIFFPMAALAAWTFAVLLLIPIAGFAPGGEARSTPATSATASRRACRVRIASQPQLHEPARAADALLRGLHRALRHSGVDAYALALAWLYFALRVGHSLVHLTYNNVYHRLGVYAASGVVLALLWVRFAAALFTGG
jgi:hypothetical protein